MFCAGFIVVRSHLECTGWNADDSAQLRTSRSSCSSSRSTKSVDLALAFRFH
mgnify:CR=1 FL=1